MGLGSFIWYGGASANYAMTIWLRHGDLISWYLVKNTGEAVLLFQQNRYTFTNSAQCIHDIFEQSIALDLTNEARPSTVDWQEGLYSYTQEESGSISSLPPIPPSAFYNPNRRGTDAALTFFANRPVRVTRTSNANTTSFVREGGSSSSSFLPSNSLTTSLFALTGEIYNSAVAALPDDGTGTSDFRTGTATTLGRSDASRVIISVEGAFQTQPSTFVGSADIAISTAFSTLPNHQNGMGAIVSHANGKLLITSGLNSAPLGFGLKPRGANEGIGIENVGAAIYAPQTLGLAKYDYSLVEQGSQSYSFELNMEAYDPGFTYSGYTSSFSQRTPAYTLNGKVIQQPLDFESDQDYAASLLSGKKLFQIFSGGVTNFALTSGNNDLRFTSQLPDWPTPQVVSISASRSINYLKSGGGSEVFNAFDKDYTVIFSQLKNEAVLDEFLSADSTGLYSAAVYDQL